MNDSAQSPPIQKVCNWQIKWSCATILPDTIATCSFRSTVSLSGALDNRSNLHREAPPLYRIKNGITLKSEKLHTQSCSLCLFRLRLLFPINIQLLGIKTDSHPLFMFSLELIHGTVPAGDLPHASCRCHIGQVKISTFETYQTEHPNS